MLRPADVMHAPCRSDPAPLQGSPAGLHPWAVDWLHALPAVVRPILAAVDHPGRVNQLAAVWPDPARRLRFLEGLLARHSSACGLSQAARRELDRLRLYAELLRSDEAQRFSA